MERARGQSPEVEVWVGVCLQPGGMAGAQGLSRPAGRGSGLERQACAFP